VTSGSTATDVAMTIFRQLLCRSLRRLGCSICRFVAFSQEMTPFQESISEFHGVVFVLKGQIRKVGLPHLGAKLEKNVKERGMSHHRHYSWIHAGDHRFLDGATLARFHAAFKGYVENPVHMLVHLK
jgi:hypothetical protein